MNKDNMKVVETNIFVDYENNPINVQYRIVEIESWDKYIEEIKEKKQKRRIDIIGSLHGPSIPFSHDLLNFESNSRMFIGEYYIKKVDFFAIKAGYLIKNKREKEMNKN